MRAMATSLYDLTVPALIRGLKALSGVLEKGRAHAAANGLDPKTLIEARLYEDMAPLTAQVQRVSDTAKGCAVRLGQLENVSFPDTETTFEELQDRVARTIAFLESVPREAIDGKEDADVVLQAGTTTIPFKGRDYVQNFVLPNFYFHVTVAYSLLRHHGVPVGKRDYLGAA
jgi:hypothetical protein